MSLSPLQQTILRMAKRQDCIRNADVLTAVYGFEQTVYTRVKGFGRRHDPQCSWSLQLRLQPMLSQPVTLAVTKSAGHHHHPKPHDNVGKPAIQPRRSLTINSFRVPDCRGKQITLLERDQILLELEQMMPGRRSLRDRVSLLNARGVPVSMSQAHYGGTWTKDRVADITRSARQRHLSNRFFIAFPPGQ